MNFSRFFALSMIILAFSLNSYGAVDEELKNALFTDLKGKIDNARMNKAELYSPQNFAKAEKVYKQACEDFNASKDPADIRRNMELAMNQLKKVDANIELSKATLTKVMAARDDAIKAMAPQYDLSNFKRAEELFTQAAGKIESGEVASAGKIASRAEPIYRKAETRAIKEGLLGDVKKLEEKAKKEDIEDFAPKTLKNAQAKHKEALSFIDSKEYNIETARKKVEEARYQYEHAIALAQLIQGSRKQKLTMEDVYNKFERDLSDISSALNIPVGFDKGMDFQQKAVLSAVDRNSKDVEGLSQKVMKDGIDYQNKIAELNKEITDKDKQIAELKGKTAAEAENINVLKQNLERENVEREKYETIKRLFQPEEAKVLKDGGDIILQLYGLSFEPGKSTVEVENYDLLAKVQRSIREFPAASVVIEGHTDSLGDRKVNEILSEERAMAVQRYLVANKTVDEKKVVSVGYGDSRPVATNKTKEGRAMNRRIDVIIKAK